MKNTRKRKQKIKNKKNNGSNKGYNIKSTIEEKINIENIKRQLAEARFCRIEKVFWLILRLIGIVAFAITLIVIFSLIVWCIVLYIGGNSSIANIVITIIQLVTGILSLAVGVWALVLAIRSNADVDQGRSRHLNMNTSRRIIVDVGKPEDDIDENSLK